MTGDDDKFKILIGGIGNQGRRTGPRLVGDDDEFKIMMGRGRRNESFINQVLRAARKAGYDGSTAGRRNGPRCGHSTFGRGRTAFGHGRLFGAERRVVVKARVVRHRGRALSSAPLSAHVAYLERDGVTRDRERAHMFSPTEDRADVRAFVKRGLNDRHHFRFIIAPEDAAEMIDLKAFTRDLTAQMESDLGTRLDWIALSHWNTDNPHIHLLVRGVAQDGSNLVISRDYISHGLRSRAEELVSAELGPKLEHEIRSSLEREVDAERWTRLDAAIRMAADELGFIDLRPDQPGIEDPEARRLAIGRLQRLERMGLAAPAGPGQWMLDLAAEPSLRDLGMRGDIIKTMHRAFIARGQDRGVTDYVIDGATTSTPIIGRLVSTGLHNELTGEAFAVIDGIDGRAHYVRFRRIEAFADAPAAGGIVEVRRFGGPDEPRPTLVLASRSDIDLDRQVTAPGATWLDYRLVERERMPLAMSGFGQEVHDAMKARAEHLVAEGFARPEGPRIVPQPNLLSTLRRRELDAAGAKLSAETGLPYAPAANGEVVAGTCRQCVTLTSGRFAMIDNDFGFALVPWTPALEKHLGLHVAGVAKESGSIEWNFERKRRLEI
jgi:type IV secretory pathway VirD2 relaxase